MEYLYKVWSFRRDDEYGDVYDQFEGEFSKFDEAIQKLKKLEEEKVVARFYRYKKNYYIEYEYDDTFGGMWPDCDLKYIENLHDDWLDQVKSLGITE